ncbi:hypothetical protein H4S07_002483 [Coemansia furcata]|uniref:Uncharacterized protein n=1 Tax=Coemansia furcata TaxID=417177 RepID=A0ACC1LLB1_9FUNG|nr:hypothetical protein H4S07_002483 [Coemansia furcata]
MLAKSTSSTPGLFGAPSAVPAFGMSSANAPVAKPLTTFGVTGQHVFGSASKSSATTTAAFGGFGGTALSAGKSIFDAPSGSSIFDANDKAKTASPFGSTSTTSLSGPSKSTTTQPFPAPSGFGVSQAKDIGAKPSDNTPAPVSFGSAPKSTFGLSTGNITSNLFDSVKKPSPSFVPASTSKPADKERLEDEKRKEDERRKEDDKRKEIARAQEAARVLELERRNEQARLDALQRELEEKSQELIDQQYIATCNSFDRDLKALVSSVKETESAIACVRSASLPPIPLNTTIQSKAAITDASKPLTIDDTESWGRIADVLLEALHVSHDELRASQKSVTKQLSGYIKTETKREEISRILDSAASTMSLPNATVDGGLNPLQRDYQRRLKSAFALIGKRSADLEQVVLAEASRVESKVNDLPPLLRAPTFDTVQRTLLNVTKAVRQKNLELDELARLVDDMAIDEPVERSRHRERKAALPTVPATSVLARRSSRTRSTGGTDTGALRTAATGIPWSPDALPLNTPSFGRRVGGFGLSYEDLVVHDKPTDMAPVAPQQSFGHPRRSIFSNLPSKTDAIGTNPNFPHTQVRELAPRSSKVNRKASLVLDSELAAPRQESGDGASLAPTSAFSGAAAYIQARKQRSLVRDALTHSNRTAALIQSPDSTATRAYKLGSLSSSIVAEPVPMPNLERYVQAFGKLKLVEPAPSPAPEPEVQQILPAPAFGSSVAPAGKTSPLGLKAKEWQCSMCDLMSPDSAVTCVVCEHPKPGTQPAPSASLAIVNKPPPATFSGFKPSGGLSLVGLAAVLGQPPSSTSASLGTPMLSFSSFVPPTGATAALAANPTPAPSGFKPSGGLSLTQPSAPSASSASSALPFGTVSSQVPSFGAFVPPGGMAPLASVAGGSGLPTFPVAVQKDMPAPVTGNDDKWICDVCELKSPSHATACIVCETPRPSASATAPATDANVSDSDESEYSGAEDEDEGEYSDGSVDAVESNLVSDEESERELGDTEADVEVNPGNSHDVDADSGDAINAGEMTDANSASHPVLSYADAAKVALADHSGEEPASEETTVSTPDRLDHIGETPAETGNDEAPAIDLEPTTPDSARSDEHDHDSDGFVHVSQLESGLQSKADVSQADDDDDGALSIVASEASLDMPADISPSTGEHVSDMASDIGDTAQDQGETSDTESKILAALSDELDRGIPDGHTPVSEDQQQAIESELSTQNSSFDAHLVQFLSGASVTLVVDHALGCHLGVPEPAVAVEEIDATGTSAANDDDAIAPELVKVDAEVTEETHALQPDVESQHGDSGVTPGLVIGAGSTPPLQAPVEQQDEPAPVFALDGLAAGIEAALGDVADASGESDVAPERAVEQVPTDNVAAAPAQLPAVNESDTKSVFKAGRLGSFGGQLGKSTTSNLAASLSSSTTALPNAFSAVATMSTLGFGAKLDRPAFGVASMSLSGRQQPAAAMPSGSFASMGKIGAGFSSRASPSIDPFAAFKGTSNFLGASPAADTTTASSGKSSPQPILDSNSAHTPGGVSLSRQTIKTSSKPTVQQHGIKAVDPILSIIHGSDSEADKDDLDSNYDSE